MPHEAVSAKCLERTWAHSNDADLKFNRAVSKPPHLRCSELLPVFPHAVLSSIVYMEINTTLHIVWWRAGEKLRIVSLFPVPVAQHGQYKRSLCRERQAAGDKGDKDVCWRDKKVQSSSSQTFPLASPATTKLNWSLWVKNCPSSRPRLYWKCS